MKIIAWYLPQFHEIPENNEWWGNGFTEWTNMRKAQSLYRGHYQPRIPLGSDYYNLLESSTLKRQVKQAKEYGIYGFCFYHYWFGDKMLLQKPMELYLSNKELDLPFCISWANESWTNAWVSNSKKVLIEQTYGDREEWKRHFDYLTQFFNDPRYIKEDNCPLIVIYRPENMGSLLNEMIEYWRTLATDAGFAGIKVAYQHISFHTSNKDKSAFDYGIEYQPIYAMHDLQTPMQQFIARSKEVISGWLQRLFKTSFQIKRNTVIRIDYDHVWQAVLKRQPKGGVTMIPGAFVDWDNTPRRGIKGTVLTGGSPAKFEKYLTKQIERARDIYHSDKLFIFAWNEWAEGGYLEPDEKNRYAYLEAVKKALICSGEWRQREDVGA